MDLSKAHKWADSAQHPNPALLRSAGYVGIFVYGGTPESPKNCTRDYYAACRAAGLQVAWFFEHVATDFAGGQNVGRTHALRLLADMTVCGAGLHDPAGATVDTHLSAANIDQAVEYQRGFWTSLAGHPVIAYGFAEFIAAVISAGVAEVFVQAGPAQFVLDDITFWQDNAQHPRVGNAIVDIDWQLLPLPEAPEAPDVELSDKIPQTPAPGTVGKVLRDLQVGQAGSNSVGQLAEVVQEIQHELAVVTSDIAALTGLVNKVLTHLTGNTP